MATQLAKRFTENFSVWIIFENFTFNIPRVDKNFKY